MHFIARSNGCESRAEEPCAGKPPAGFCGGRYSNETLWSKSYSFYPTNTSLNDTFNTSSRDIHLEEAILEYLLQADALAEVSLSETFLECKQSTINSYLWVLASIIQKAKNHHEELIQIRLRKGRGVS